MLDFKAYPFIPNSLVIKEWTYWHVWSVAWLPEKTFGVLSQPDENPSQADFSKFVVLVMGIPLADTSGQKPRLYPFWNPHFLTLFHLLQLQT